jgi:hypothetical protein
MPPHTLHVVQAFEQRDGGIVPLEPKACPSAASARGLANRLAGTHAGVIAWSRTGDLISATGVRQRSWFALG